MGWFFGFKLHIVSNDKGEILSFYVTPGNIDDRKPLDKLTNNLTGKLFGDRGYISKQWFEQLMQQGLQLITSIKGNMKNQFIPMVDKLLLRKRFIIETINDQLKNISQIEHSRHRSITNFMVNLISGLIAYSHQKKKPSINFKVNLMMEN
jgi:transposase